METYEEFKARSKRQESSKLSRTNVKEFIIRNQKSVFFGILALGILIRVAYFLEIKSSPIPYWHKWDDVDMNFFDKWAKVISGGNILTDTVLHPHHNWYHLAADRYFEQHFDGESDKFFHLKDLPQTERNEALWNSWLKGKVFFQEPLYPYVIAATYSILDSEVIFVFILQLVLSILSAVLLFYITRRYFGLIPANIALLLYFLYGPVLYYNTTLLRATLIIFMMLLLIEGFHRVSAQRRLYFWLLYGFLLGVSVLLKSIFVLFILALIPLVFLTKEAAVTNKMKKIILVFLGLLIALTPLALRNYLVDPPVPLFSMSSVGPMGFIVANNDLWYEFVFSSRIPELMKKSDGRSLSAVYYTLLSHNSPGSVLEMIFNKSQTILSWVEAANNGNFYFGKKVSTVLHLCFFNFWWIGPLGFGGLIHYLFHKRKINTPLVYFVVIHLILLLAFYVNARFRLPLAVCLIPFSAYTITLLLSGNFMQKKLLIAVVILLLVNNLFIKKDSEQLIRPADYFWAYECYYKEKISEYVRNENWREAISSMEDYLNCQPEYIDKLLISSQVSVTFYDRQHARHFADIYLIYSVLKEKSGDESGAARLKQLAGMLKNSAI